MTYGSPIFRKLLFSAFLLIAVTLLVVDFYLTRYMAGRERQMAQETLAADARILAGELARVPPALLNAWTREAEARARARITLIAPDGRVLGDSQHDPDTMDNHAERPEVREARQGRDGFSTRHSSTLGVDLAYATHPIEYHGQAGHVLRVAIPLRRVSEGIAEVRWRILAGSIVAAALALVLAYIFSRSFTRRLRRIQKFADSLLGARTPARIEPDADDELGALAASMSRTAAQLHDLFERLTVESGRREAILSSMLEGVLAVDSDLRVTFCNDAFARAVEARMPVPEHLPLIELVRDAPLLDLLSAVLARDEIVKQRVQLTAAEGRSFEVQAAPLGAGSRRGAIAILHDITDLERLERVRKDFVANVSHELRTPLTAIRGYAETLLDGAIDDQEHNRRFLEVIRAHAIRLNNIASDLLVLSEMESGRAETDPEPISVRAALESALRTVESEARVHNVTLRTGRIDAAEVLGFRIRLEQALVNLLDNAVKFNREGGEVAVEVVAADGAARITVSDTGIGIPAEDLPRIFERFYRVDKTRSREVGGTGLGLSIVKHVVERMNGAIQVESQLGKGSKFSVTLPHNAAQPQPN